MGREDAYKSRIKAMGWARLRTFHERLIQGRVEGWEPGKAFEYLVLRAFELEGAEVTWPYIIALSPLEPGGETEQIDGAVFVDGLACIVEAKDTTQSTSIVPIAKMRNQLLRRPASTIGLIFSRGGFSRSATTLVRFVAPQTILLWKGEEVAHALKHRAFRTTLHRK
ncbi:restriction endonuclease [Archangium violaceum]|uniref:restriction endonuclease n=1 Tax=Archangium violaceum TaxID=83451 RepID=UPI0019529D28|nr:restriction endonuclease [Archangium violaceum]QRN93398.1 restriction endonuclease [Archangium violaceum]